MTAGFVWVVGRANVLDEGKWEQYRSAVPETLAPWGGEIMVRGEVSEVLVGQTDYQQTVVIRFPDAASVAGWFQSDSYQALVPLREAAAQLQLVSYG